MLHRTHARGRRPLGPSRCAQLGLAATRVETVETVIPPHAVTTLFQGRVLYSGKPCSAC
jgi:hypothetical protein